MKKESKVLFSPSKRAPSRRATRSVAGQLAVLKADRAARLLDLKVRALEYSDAIVGSNFRLYEIATFDLHTASLHFARAHRALKGAE